MRIKKLLILVFLFLSCETKFGYESFQIGKEILSKDLLINLKEGEYPEGVSLILENEVNCDLQLDLFSYNREDSLFLVRSVKISDFVDQEYRLDFYSKPILVTVNKEYKTDCDLLDLELIVFTNKINQ